MEENLKNAPDYSVVIPCYNEEESLQELCDRLTATMEKIGGRYEILFVDDGSTDRSEEILRELHKKDGRIKSIHFRKNFGKAQALSQGFLKCRGRIVITLDADLQDMPEEIPRLLEQMDRGLDLVSGWKRDRRDPLSRRLASTIFNFFTSSITGIKIHDFNCGLKVYKKDVTKNMRLYGEIYRFIPALAGWRGFKVGEVVVDHRPRMYGKSKFGNERFLRGFFDLVTILFLTRYTSRPLHLFGALGAVLSLVGFSIDGYLAVLWFTGHHIGHRPLLTLGTLLIIIGIQFIFFGLLGELIVFSSHKDAGSIVKDTYGIES